MHKPGILTTICKYTRCKVLHFFVFCVFFVLSTHTAAQKKVIWLQDSIPAILTDSTFIHKPLLVQKSILDSLVNQKQAEGYLEASLDTVFHLINALYIDFHEGILYSWKSLDVNTADPLFVRHIRPFAESILEDTIDIGDLQKILDRSVAYYEERGYPFAVAYLDTIILSEGQLSAVLRVIPGRFMKIKEVINAGDAKISSTYLERYLGVLPGKAFEKSKITLEGQKRLAEIPFATQRRPPLLHFIDDEVSVNVFLNKRNASRFDFVLGLQPNSKEAGRFLITGTANLDLYNQLGLGERFYLQYQSLRPQTQEIKAVVNYPYLLDLPFGIEGSFGLYSRDSTNRDIQAEIGFLYLLEAGNYLKAFYQQMNTDLIQVNTANIVSRRRLPSFLDVRNSFYGLEWLQQKLDYRFNPRRGWSIHTRASIGSRGIKINDQIADLKDPNDPEFDFASLYDTINLRGVQARGQLTAAWYIPMGKLSTVKIGVQSGYVYSPQTLSGSEVFRIGGNRILRGFDEESIFSNHYQILTAEYRLLTGQNGNIFAFGNLGYVQDQSGEEILENFPYGFGAGLNFETTLGIFGVTFAVGAQQQNPLDFRAARIHFGYVSLF